MSRVDGSGRGRERVGPPAGGVPADVCVASRQMQSSAIAARSGSMSSSELWVWAGLWMHLSSGAGREAEVKAAVEAAAL